MSERDLEPGELQDEDDSSNGNKDLNKFHFGDPPKIIFGIEEHMRSPAPVERLQSAVLIPGATEKTSFTERRETGQSHGQTSVSSYAQYRSAPARQTYDSDSSGLESDEDTPMWNRKRAKYMASKTRETTMEVTCTLPEKQERGDSVKTGRGKLTSNNIWGAVLEEQDLTQNLGTVAMKKILNQDRNVESYDFTNAYDDKRPPVERHSDSDQSDNQDVFTTAVEPEDCTEVKKECNKRPAKSRLGKRKKCARDSYHSNYSTPSTVTAESSDHDVVNWLANALDEPKKRLLYIVVETIGKEITLKVAKEAIELDEGGGGMMTVDGSRRRTKGGVFFQLLRQADGISKKKLNKIRSANFNMDTKANKKWMNKHNKSNTHTGKNQNGRQSPDVSDRMESTTAEGSQIAKDTDSSSDEAENSAMTTETDLGIDVFADKSLECMEDEIILE